MKSVNVVLITALVVSLLGVGSPSVQAQTIEPKYRPGELIIQFSKEGDVDATAEAFIAASEGNSEVLSEALGIVRLTLPDVASATALGEVNRALTDLPNVLRAEPNYIYKVSQFQHPNDPGLTALWYLQTIGAFDAWSVQNESPNVTVAVIDTGVFLNHDDLKDNLIAGYDFYNDDADPSPDLINVPTHPLLCNVDPSEYPTLFPTQAYEAHGTHVAGTIGALGDNNRGIVGVTRKVKIMPLKFLGGSCGSGDLADAVRAIDYAIQHDADIINASWEGPNSAILFDIIKQANEKEILFVTAAGNDNQNLDHTPLAPASYDLPNILVVGASTIEDSRAGFSNFGQTVNIAAPGVDILSTVPAGNGPQPESGYDTLEGTSMAAPIISGAAALLMAYYPALTHLEVKELLLLSADTSIPLVDAVSGGRRLNLARALKIDDLPNTINESLAGLSEEERQAFLASLTPLDRVRLLIAPQFVPPLVASNPVEIDEGVVVAGPTPSPEQPTELSGSTEGDTFTLPREFVITASSLADAVAVQAALEPFTATLNTVVSEPLKIYEITISSDLPTDELTAALEAVPGIERAEPNYWYTQNK